MKPNPPEDQNRLETDIRQALAAESPEMSTDCLELSGLLDVIERVDAGGEPAALAHIATCAYCRREYVSLRAAFSEADALRPAEEPITRVAHPAGHSPWDAFRAWISAPFHAPAFRLGAFGATALATALLGFVVGLRQAPQVLVPVASQPAPSLQAARELREARSELLRLQAENKGLQQQVSDRRAATPNDAARVVASPPRPPLPVQPARLDQPAPRPNPPAPPRAFIVPVERGIASFMRPMLSVAMTGGLRARGGDPSDTSRLSPARTWVTDDRPVFRCRFAGAGPETRYTVRLVAPSGEMLTTEIVGPELTWRPGFALPRGEALEWTVTATVGSRIYTATAGFGVLTEDEAARARSSAARVKGLERARLYRRAGLLLDAEAVLLKEPASRSELSEVQDAMRPQVAWAEPEEASVPVER